MEELLDLFYALCRKVYDLIFFIYDKVSGLLDLLTHNGIKFVKLGRFLTAGQLPCQNITYLVELC